MKHLAILTALAIGLSVGMFAPAPGVAAEADRSTPITLADDDETQEAKAKVLVIHADNSGTGIDPALEHLEDKLTQPPFNAYDSYSLKKELTKDLEKGKSKSVRLPDKGKLKLKLVEVHPPESDDEKTRYTVKASIRKPSGKKFVGLEVKTEEDEIFFVAGRKYKKGILVLGISISKK